MKQDDMDILWKLIKDVDTAMLTTATEEGLVSRPMRTQEVEFDGDLWFFTKKDTDKFDQIVHNQDVNVAYVGESYVSVRGTAEIVEDSGKKKELWSKVHEKIMQTSYDDPNIILIKVKVEAAEYWEEGNLIKKAAFYYNRMTGQNADTTDINETIEFDN
ncbi:pyridoxamine 5'-phosphate oxidase family protein [Virgibacillus sp. MSP4-1]|uniref:pyridoxamine 5'-phosphate oxidase family protein n=1 Tax=Virgibacillus sp. MSP4-1 TaxID=2700081 RepID=UPI0003A3EF80|nr:pyridoxamine 5'-phosphate oxidase family protein [Virgibacillus sp. MSP4-1]QHS21792.1 pyridoxamine 5'-phosphate oxidase family protein [Virgibacillus sp. MSP4-1]